MKNQWSIHVVTQSVALGKWDKLATLINGKKVAHSFLIATNEDNDVVWRMDGLAYDRKGNLIAECSSGLKAYMSYIADSLALTSVFERVANAVGLGKHIPRLEIICTNGDEWPIQDDAVARTVATGSKEHITNLWRTATQAADAIRSRNLPYIPSNIYRGGQNCHSVTASLLKSIGVCVNANDFEHYAVPGISNTLLDDSENATRPPLPAPTPAPTEQSFEQDFVPA